MLPGSVPPPVLSARFGVFYGCDDGGGRGIHARNSFLDSENVTHQAEVSNFCFLCRSTDLWLRHMGRELRLRSGWDILRQVVEWLVLARKLLVEGEISLSRLGLCRVCLFSSLASTGLIGWRMKVRHLSGQTLDSTFIDVVCSSAPIHVWAKYGRAQRTDEDHGVVIQSKARVATR